MDFQEILKTWERKNSPQKTAKILEDWLKRNPVHPKAEEEEVGKEAKALRRKALREMAPQAELDLHGHSTAEALASVERFLKESKRKGLKKVLIIHGKGNHSQGEPILASNIRNYLQHSPIAGECGTPEARYGGRGAVWVIIR